MWFMPKVLLVSSHIFLAYWRLEAYIIIYLSLNVHWKPNYVYLMLSRPASWTVMPALDIPVRAPRRTGKPNVAWGMVSSIFQINRILCLFIPVFDCQSRFLIVKSFPPSVLFPQAAKNEQWILFLLMKFFKNFTASKRFFSTILSNFSLWICKKSLMNSSTRE